MAEIKITKCKSCGASITWIKTKNGRVMPCDVPAVDYQENYKGTDTVVTDDGRVLRVMVFKNPSPSGLQPIIDGKGYISHFATCPYANKYDDGITDKYCDVVLKSAPKSEINEEGLFVETFSFERQTYWYERVEESFALKSTRAEDTKFPLGFPFGFAGRVFKSKYKITNSFFVNAPITIRITGAIANNIRLYLQSLDGKTIEEIALSTNNADGTEILIEPTTKKITVTTDGVSTNGYGLTDKTKQSFLYLPQGEYFIGANMTADDDGAIEVSIKRYLFD